jgi:hypothetical protein
MLNHRNQGRNVGAFPAHPCRSQTLKLNLLKYRLRRKLASEIEGRVPDRLARQAIAEAEALAWSTSHPLLFLPGLMEEKLHSAGQWAARQREILERQKALTVTE